MLKYELTFLALCAATVFTHSFAVAFLALPVLALVLVKVYLKHIQPEPIKNPMIIELQQANDSLFNRVTQLEQQLTKVNLGRMR